MLPQTALTPVRLEALLEHPGPAAGPRQTAPANQAPARPPQRRIPNQPGRPPCAKETACRWRPPACVLAATHAGFGRASAAEKHPQPGALAPCRRARHHPAHGRPAIAGAPAHSGSANPRPGSAPDLGVVRRPRPIPVRPMLRQFAAGFAWRSTSAFQFVCSAWVSIWLK